MEMCFLKLGDNVATSVWAQVTRHIDEVGGYWKILWNTRDDYGFYIFVVVIATISYYDVDVEWNFTNLFYFQNVWRVFGYSLNLRLFSCIKDITGQQRFSPF